MSNRVLNERDLRRGLLASILMGLILAAFGCSDRGSVTGPGSPRRVDSDPIGTTRVIDDVDDGDDDGFYPGPPIIVPHPPSKTDTISADGGEIEVGAYKVEFCPGAVAEKTEIRVVDVSADRGYPCVELYPEGIHFNQPVTLTVQLPASANNQGYTMWWWGTDKDEVLRWINIGGTVSPDGRTLSVKLEHFSTYAPGKAGWWKPNNPIELPLPEDGGN